MKKLKLRILLTAAALVTLAGGMALTPKAHAAQTLLWSDEFNGTSVDTSQWTVYNQADGSDSWYSPTNVTESGGELRIANVQQTSGSIHWGGGGMEIALEAETSYKTFSIWKWVVKRYRYDIQENSYHAVLIMAVHKNSLEGILLKLSQINQCTMTNLNLGASFSNHFERLYTISDVNREIT